MLYQKDDKTPRRNFWRRVLSVVDELTQAYIWMVYIATGQEHQKGRFQMLHIWPCPIEA